MSHICLIGAPGSGKSSIASAFAKASNGAYEHISSGQIARHLAEFDENTQTALQRGDYAPESAMRNEIKAHIERVMLEGREVIVEGFPRMLAQVVVLEEALKSMPLYVEITCPHYICLHRAITRGREHDKPDSIASRFEAFERDTHPVIEMLYSGARFTRITNHSEPVATAVASLRKTAEL